MVVAGLVIAMLLGGHASPRQPQTFEDCDALRREHPDARPGPICYYTVGHRLGELEEARRRLEPIVMAEPEQAWARIALANTLVDLGEREHSIELAQAALDDLQRRDDVTPGELATIELNLASTLRERGRLDEAIEHFERAEEHAARTSVPALLAMARLELANARWLRGGELARVRALVDDALPVTLASGQYMYAAKALVIAANVASGSGDVATAIAHRERILELVTAEGDAYSAAGVMAVLATLYADQFDPRLEGADPTPHVTRARTAVEAAERAENPHAAAVARCALGYLEQDDSLAIEHLRACLATEERVGFAAGAYNAKTTLADRLAALGTEHHDEARALAREGLHEARASGALGAMLKASASLSGVLWQIGDREAAIEEGLRCLEHVELLRDLQLDERDRTHTLHHYAFAYYLLSGKLLERPQRTEAELELAFSTMERLRARTLLERLVLADAAPLTSHDHRGTERQGLLRAIAAVQRRLLATALSDHERSVELAALAELEERERRLRSEIARHDGRFAELRMPTPPELATVAASLAPDQAIFAFQVSDTLDQHLAEEGGSWLLVITRERVTTHRLPDRHWLERQVPMLEGLVLRRDGSEVPALVRLHRDLLEDALAELDPRIERLVLVPDGVLYDVPFGALRRSPDEPMLAERFELTSSPSVTGFARWQGHTARRDGGLLALASAGPSPHGSGQRGGALDEALTLGPLPRAETEARRIATIFGTAEVRTGERASESFLKSAALDGFDVLHFATHAVVDLDHPERSGVTLAAGSAEEDGLLQAREIVELPLRGRAIVLSACSGLSGAPVHGEGLMSLSRAFLLAGADVVVASRWPLDDDDALLLFERLYAHVDEGDSLATALTRAQRDLVRAGAPTAAWAGVVVLGRGDLVLRPRAPLERWLRRHAHGRGPIVVGALAAMLLGLVMAWRRWPRERHR
ncbi:CHAT domain-containing protein [Paraliomyxa miuraensis]|uniref:CHAT domain-containing protein n=1 Tax=Paraliomyxa miuraensis TaxID=376150 RepID=UPI00225751EA|nr:CHAT domain-containing protein [Paraliomyxa miuraensis]MCX4246775.1 CHAT domain-containing protein [Paraliomyxa miuraensis]